MVHGFLVDSGQMGYCRTRFIAASSCIVSIAYDPGICLYCSAIVTVHGCDSFGPRGRPANGIRALRDQIIGLRRLCGRCANLRRQVFRPPKARIPFAGKLSLHAVNCYLLYKQCVYKDSRLVVIRRGHRSCHSAELATPGISSPTCVYLGARRQIPSVEAPVE